MVTMKPGIIQRQASTFAAIMGDGRTGSKWLQYLLSNHPEINCPRFGALSRNSVHGRLAKQFNVRVLLDAVRAERGYKTAVVRIGTGGLVKEYANHFWDYMAQYHGKIIYLFRENVVRQAVSRNLFSVSSKGRITFPEHIFGDSDREPIQIHFAPDEVIAQARRSLESQVWIRGLLAEKGFPVLTLAYEELAGGIHQDVVGAISDATSKKICKFLNVSVHPLYSLMRRTNPWKLSQITTNWEELRMALLATEFAIYVEAEE